MVFFFFFFFFFFLATVHQHAHAHDSLIATTQLTTQTKWQFRTGFYMHFPFAFVLLWYVTTKAPLHVPTTLLFSGSEPGSNNYSVIEASANDALRELEKKKLILTSEVEKVREDSRKRFKAGKLIVGEINGINL